MNGKFNDPQRHSRSDMALSDQPGSYAMWARSDTPCQSGPYCSFN